MERERMRYQGLQKENIDFRLTLISQTFSSRFCKAKDAMELLFVRYMLE